MEDLRTEWLGTLKTLKTAGLENDPSSIVTGCSATVDSMERDGVLTKESAGRMASDLEENIVSAFKVDSFEDADNIKGSVPSEWVEDLNLEGATGTAITATTVVTRAVNALDKKQDEFGEGFFRSVSIDPRESTVKVVSGIPSYYGNWDKHSKSKIPITSLATDRSFLLKEENKLYPILEGNEEVLDETYVETTSDNIKTAPIKFNFKPASIDIVERSTDAPTISGIKNVTRQLSPNMQVTDLILKNTDGSKRTKVGVKPLHLISGETNRGAKAEFVIPCDNKEITFKVGSVLSPSGTSVTQDNGDYIVKAQISFNISGNLEYGSINRPYGTVNITEVYTVDGQIVADGEVRTEILDVVDGLELYSFFMDMYVTTGDLHKEGRVFTTDDTTVPYNVGYKTPITVKSSIASLYGERDIDSLALLVNNTGLTASAAGVSKLLEYADILELNKNSAVSIPAPGNKYASSFFLADTLDMRKAVSNIETKDIEDSISQSLRSTVKAYTLKMLKDSGIRGMLRIISPDKRIQVTVGTDTTISEYLDGFSLRNTDIKVVASDDMRINDQIIGAVTSNTTGDITIEDTFTLGVFANAPTIVVDTKRTVGGSTFEGVTAFPRWEHLVFTPVMFRIRVKNLDELILLGAN